VFESNPPGRARRAVVGILAAASFALGVAPATAATPPGPPPVSTSMLTEQERAFVTGATQLTDLSAAEALDIFRNRPDLALMIPVSITDVVQSSASSPAGAPASATSANLPVPVRSCWVWTRRKIRNRAGMVLFSFRMAQRWEYNFTRVWPHTPRTTWDVTDWGAWLGGWHYNGIVDSGGYFKAVSGVSRYALHRSYRTGQFKTAEVAGGITVNVPLFIEKLYNGDWVSTTKFGLPGCRNA
jgi:hypothetical protein